MRKMKTFRRKKSKKRGTLKHYTLLNKAGTINRISRIREFLDDRIGSDLTPSILRSHAATRIARSYTRSRSSYAKSIIPFLHYLMAFYSHLNQPITNTAFVKLIKTRLLTSMPDGTRLERFLNSPNLSIKLEQLRVKLNEPHPNKIILPSGEYVASGTLTPQFSELILLVLDLKTIIEQELSRHITIPPYNRR